MAAKLIGYAETGLTTAKFVRKRKSDGAYWNTSGTPAFEAYNASNIASYGIAATETGATGSYTATDPAEGAEGDFLLVKAAGASLAVSDLIGGARWQDAVLNIGSPAGASIAADIAEIEAETDGIAAIPTTAPLDAAGIRSAVGLASANLDTQFTSISVSIPDLYHADIHFTRDQTNSVDEYEIRWFKNGVRITSGITVPTIQVIKRVDGTDLIAATTLTQIGSTGAYKYTASSAERLTQGEAGEAVASATIDSATRTFSRIVGRDS